MLREREVKCESYIHLHMRPHTHTQTNTRQQITLNPTHLFFCGMSSHTLSFLTVLAATSAPCCRSAFIHFKDPLLTAWWRGVWEKEERIQQMKFIHKYHSLFCYYPLKRKSKMRFTLTHTYVGFSNVKHKIHLPPTTHTKIFSIQFKIIKIKDDIKWRKE